MTRVSTAPRRDRALPTRDLALPRGGVVLPRGGVVLPRGGVVLPRGDVVLPRGGRAFVMIAVLVVVAAAILVATGAIFAARAATVTSRASDTERRLRDAALDGVLLAADRVAADRERILAGAVPTAEPLVLEIPDGDRRIEVRLVPQWSGELFASEAAKLDANLASPAVLEKLTEDSAEVARELVARLAARRPLTSVDALPALAPPADAADALREVLGPLRAIGDERDELDESGAESRSRASIPPLVELLTVHGAEPLVDASGAAKLDLVAAFGDGAAGQSTASLQQFEDAERDVLEAAVREARGEGQGAGGAADDGLVARGLLARGVDPARVDQILAGCTLEAGTHGAPRLDIVRADVRALAALDGLGAEAAARIADLRDSLDETERKGTSWLVSRRALTPEQYGAVAGRITHRSALWRYRVEARIERADAESGVRSARSRSTATGAPSDEPRATYAFDCVVDVSTERPRIAFLRDIALLPTARALAVLARDAAGDTRDDAAGDGAGDAAGDAAGDGASDREMPKSDLDGGVASGDASDGFSGGTQDELEGGTDDASSGGARAGSRRSPRPDFDFRPPTARMPSRSGTGGAGAGDRATETVREPPARGRVSPTGRDRGGR
jgi:hypothetical protein